uniref:Uncharacterized protein n=1 Tax=Anopheles minimus TaxID=112268 RepID=A0A182WMZ6_9DIPT
MIDEGRLTLLKADRFQQRSFLQRLADSYK